MKNYKMHVIPHMHWDREWYFTTEESRILLVNNMEEIITRLESDENYTHYILDGQTAILEDYFKVKPEMKSRVEALARKGKFILGPWYTQTDEIVVGAESITRNLLYGFKDCTDLGVDPMRIGYLPDSFGQTEQLPTILNGFNINRSVFWRGCSEKHGTNKTEFIWKSLDGSDVTAQILPLGYAIGKYLPQEKEALKKRMDVYNKVLKNGATTEHLVLPHGHDQMPLQKDIFEVMDILEDMYPEIEFKMNNYDELFEALEANRDNLDVLIGEFIDGKYMRVHRSISSTRMDIKYLSTLLENKMANILEPLASLCYAHGFEYHHGLMENLWKEMMKNHAHDSIGCCCSDEVHREILARFLWASDAMDKLILFYERKIADHVKNDVSNEKVVVYNLQPNAVSSVINVRLRSKYNDFVLVDSEGNNVEFNVLSKQEIDPGLVDRQIVHYGSYDPFIEYDLEVYAKDLDAFSYETYFVKKENASLEVSKTTELRELNNEFLSVKVNGNGTLTVIDKQNNLTYNDVLLIEEGSDDGDEYDYSPLVPEQELIITSKEAVADVTFKQTSLTQTAVIKLSIVVPKDLEARKARVLDTTLKFEFKVELKKNDPVLHITSTVHNNVKDHRVRVHIPTNIAAKESIADQQFGMITRPVYDVSQDIWEQEKWKEKPVDIYSMMSFVGLSDENNGLALFTKGIREYEIIGDHYDTIAFTLLRGIGVLGKENLYYRPLRPSGIKLPTPDSQMLDTYTFEFGLYSHKNSTEEANVTTIARRYLTEVQSYHENSFNAMKLNKQEVSLAPSNKLLQLSNDAVTLSVVKKAEREDALVVRVFNPSRTRNNDTTLTFFRNVKEAKLVNLNEEVLDSLKVENNSIDLKNIKPCQPITVMVKLG